MEGEDGEEVKIVLPGAGYTWEFQVGNQMCYLMVQPWDQEEAVLGNIFLTNFVTTFKQSENKIQL